MDQNTEKQLVLEALAEGRYEATYEPVNSIYQCTKPDGTEYYVMEDLDGARSSLDLGSLTIEVEGTEYHEFIYDMNGGSWYGDDLCKDDEVICALEKLDEFIDYEDYNGDRQWEVYAKVYGIPDGTEWYFDDGCGNDCDDDCDDDYDDDCDDESEAGEIGLPLKYFISMPHGACSEFMAMDGVVTEEELDALVDLAKEQGFLEEDLDEEEEEGFTDYMEDEFELASEDFREVLPELYAKLMRQVEEQAEDDGYDNGKGCLGFVVVLSRDML